MKQSHPKNGGFAVHGDYLFCSICYHIELIRTFSVYMV